MKTHVERMSSTTSWCVFRDLPSGGEEYLHKDLSWHTSTDDGSGTFPGIFASEQEARETLKKSFPTLHTLADALEVSTDKLLEAQRNSGLNFSELIAMNRALIKRAR